MTHVLWQFVIVVDQGFNVLCFWLPGGCWADETLSSRAHRIQDTHPRLRRFLNAVFFWQDDHCLEAYESERKRLQAPPETR